jgi:hypothetical protein
VVYEKYASDELNDVSTKPKGGGGTDVRCVPQYIQDEQIKAQAVIVLTDGYLYIRIILVVGAVERQAPCAVGLIMGKVYWTTRTPVLTWARPCILNQGTSKPRLVRH